MKLNKIIFLMTFFLLCLLLPIISSCSLTPNIDLSGGLIGPFSEPGSNDMNFELSYNGLITSNLTFTASGCDNNKVILKIESPLNFKMSGTTDYLLLKGIDVNVLELNTNSAGIFVDVNNSDNKVGLSTFEIDIPLIKIAGTGKKEIKMIERERDFSKNVDYLTAHGLELKLTNVEIYNNSELDINIISKKPNYENNSVCYKSKGVDGGPAILDVNSIINYGSLYLNVLASNGGKGTKGKRTSGTGCGGINVGHAGGDGGVGGYSKVDLVSLKNFGFINMFLIAGDGGDGGKGSSESSGALHGGHARAGGLGGSGGDVNLNIIDIINKDNINEVGSLKIFLKSGSGGNGGNAGDNHSSCDSEGHGVGGSGGNAGNVNFSVINNFINSSDLNLSVIAGNGGKGRKRSCKKHKNGSGGNGGYVSDLNIISLKNDSDNFSINIISGKMGGADAGNKKGKSGSTGNINIDYLKNITKGIEIITKINQTEEEFASSLCCEEIDNYPSSGDITINNLLSGSYLPKKLQTVNNSPLDFSKIDIDGCYIKTSGIDSLQYHSNSLFLNLANVEFVASDIDTSHINLITLDNRECPHCPAIELQNSFWRIDDEYSIYSDVSGTIEIGDLNIYYAKDSNSEDISWLPTPLGHIPLYTNKDAISSIYDTKLSSGNLTIYKYPIAKSNLRWWKKWDDTAFNFLDEDKLYCYGQQYYIKGKITKDNGEKVNFNFPFIPLFRQV